MTQGLTIQRKFHLRRGHCSRKVIKEGPPPEAQPAPPGSIPRISRLMALAIRFDRVATGGAISDQEHHRSAGNAVVGVGPSMPEVSPDVRKPQTSVIASRVRRNELEVRINHFAQCLYPVI